MIWRGGGTLVDVLRGCAALYPVPESHRRKKWPACVRITDTAKPLLGDVCGSVIKRHGERSFTTTHNLLFVSQGCPYRRFVISMRSKLMLNYIISLKYSLLLGGKELFHYVLKLALLLYADIVNMIVYFNRPFVRCVFHFRRHPIAPASPV